MRTATPPRTLVETKSKIRDSRPVRDDTAINDSEAGEPGRVQIGVVAERLGLSVRTLHHWEEMGLVTPSARSTGGFRLYTEQDIARLTVIRRMKPLGFTLDQMKELLEAFEFLQRRIADPGAPGTDADVAAAEATVAACREQVAVRREELERHLAWADEFDGLLVRKEL